MGYYSILDWTSHKDVLNHFISELPEWIIIKKKTAAKAQTWLLLHCKKKKQDFIVVLLISSRDGKFYLKEMEHNIRAPQG